MGISSNLVFDSPFRSCTIFARCISLHCQAEADKQSSGKRQRIETHQGRFRSSFGSYLDPGRNVINDADGSGVWVTGQAVGDEVILHLPWGLGACFLPIDGFTRWTLKASILGSKEKKYFSHLSVII